MVRRGGEPDRGAGDRRRKRVRRVPGAAAGHGSDHVGRPELDPVRARPGRAAGAVIFVLVHGAWHGGWVWRRVAARLRRAGHEVLTPTLTGLSDRAHLISPAGGLATHIEDGLRLAEAE